MPASPALARCAGSAGATCPRLYKPHVDLDAADLQLHVIGAGGWEGALAAEMRAGGVLCGEGKGAVEGGSKEAATSARAWIPAPPK